MRAPTGGAAIVESDPGSPTPRGSPYDRRPGIGIPIAAAHGSLCPRRPLSVAPPPTTPNGACAGTTATDHGRAAAWPPGALEREPASAAPGGHDADRPQPRRRATS